ncbi:MAG: hypothetical protein U0Q16_26315 [Bryobacteraceae bacterium]
MATAAQNEANRANAQHSTGPRTAEGKSRSAANSLRHGLCAKHLIVMPGEQEQLDELTAALRAELDPQGALEELLFDDILRARWSIFRCSRAEEDLVLNGIDPLIEDAAHKAFTRIESYRRANERTFHRALKELKALQSERAFREMVYADAEETPAHSPLIDFPKIRQAYLKERTQSSHAAAAAVDAFIASPPPLARAA